MTIGEIKKQLNRWPDDYDLVVRERECFKEYNLMGAYLRFNSTEVVISAEPIKEREKDAIIRKK